MRRYALLILLLCLSLPAAAQDDVTAPLTYGQSVSGQLNNTTPRAVSW